MLSLRHNSDGLFRPDIKQITKIRCNYSVIQQSLGEGHGRCTATEWAESNAAYMHNLP